MAKIYNTAEKIAQGLEARETRFYREAAKGSTGVYGKRFESDQRLLYKLDNGLNVYGEDFKAKKPRQVDMFVIVNGKKRRVEIKTGHGALVYSLEREEAWAALESMKRSTTLFVWDVYKDGNPYCFILGELLQALEQYNDKGLATWFAFNPAKGNRANQLNFQPVHTSKKKMRYLEDISNKIGFDWETVKQTQTLE